MKFLVIFYNFMGISPDPRSCAQILVTSFCPLHPPVMERGIRISTERDPAASLLSLPYVSWDNVVCCLLSLPLPVESLLCHRDLSSL